jgi:adenosylmethionine---8-amino-7-oxononanoate aminotransferase
MALGVTSCTQEIYEAFLSEDRKKTLFHSHSFTANPLACTAGLASLDLLLTDETNNKILKINQLHIEFAQRMRYAPTENGGNISRGVSHTPTSYNNPSIRIKGTILAIEIQTAEGTSYFNNIRDVAYQFFIEKGILIRPLGNVIYLLPPYCISEEDLECIYGCIEAFLDIEV